MRVVSVRLIVVLFSILLFLVWAGPLSAGGKVTLQAGQEVLMELEKPGVVLIQGEAYSYRILKKGKRIKLVSQGSGNGIYFKRYGTTIRIRDLEGNLLHLIKKSGYFYRVKTVMGTILSSMKIEPTQVVVENSGNGDVIRVSPLKGEIVFRIKKGEPFMVLKGETRPFPAAFFAMASLSLEEQVACYLAYR